MWLRVLCLVVFLYSCHLASAINEAPQPPLSYYASKVAPFINLHGDAIQTQPIYIGATPWEIVNGIKAKTPRVWVGLKELGELQLNLVVNAMFPATNEPIPNQLLFEVWPTYDDGTGQLTWAIARWTDPTNPAAPWQFVDVEIPEDYNYYDCCWVNIKVPTLYRPWNETEAALLFDDYTQLDNLYLKAAFGDCVFTQENDNGFTGGFITGAWLSPDDANRNEKRKEIMEWDTTMQFPDRIVCRALPQPSRFNSEPITFVVGVSLRRFNSTYIVSKISWPSNLEFSQLNQTLPPTPANDSLIPQITSWPDDFMGTWRQDILWLDGEEIATYPISGKKVRFSHKSAADPRSRLYQVFDWLAERYIAMDIGAELKWMNWTYRNISETNLIVVLPGTDRSLDPVLIADHVDTAYCEDIFENTGQRVSNPGADDNGSGTATLLKTGEILGSPNNPHKRDIWLVHLTGEEYPSDGIGVRHVFMNLLNSTQMIRGMIQLDMISWRRNSSDTIFQINAGASAASLEIAKYAYEVSKYINEDYSFTSIEAAFRWRFDWYSYLYNTDALTPSDMGYPVILINEHINRFQNFDRPYYHTSKDLVNTIDVPYGCTVAKVAIETVAQLANS